MWLESLWLWFYPPFFLFLCSCRSEWCNWDPRFLIQFVELRSVFRCSGSHVCRVSYVLLLRMRCGCVASLMLCVELVSVVINAVSQFRPSYVKLWKFELFFSKSFYLRDDLRLLYTRNNNQSYSYTHIHTMDTHNPFVGLCEWTISSIKPFHEDLGGTQVSLLIHTHMEMSL